MLGTREPGIYGSTTLADIEALCHAKAKASGISVRFLQSNHEGVMIDAIHAARADCDGIILNAGAYTHTSVALLDALGAAELPSIELHLSNVHRREAFRGVSYISKAVQGIICGFGAKGYELAIDAMLGHLESSA